LCKAQRRDPHPETPVNEFRDEYYERIAYSNEHFASAIPGWMSDRGKIYISYGKPDRIEKGRTDFGNLKNILFETWFYDDLDPFGSKYQFTFTDPIQNNSFRMSDEDREKLLKLSSNGLVQRYGSY
jgi:GWxTD domain-containing protein